MGLFSFAKQEISKMNWISLTKIEQLDTILDDSRLKPVVLFKHSTRCSISLMAKSRLDQQWDVTVEEADVYYLDLLRYRAISDQIAQLFNVVHQSPQVLVIKNGICTYSATHSGIDSRLLKQAL